MNNTADELSPRFTSVVTVSGDAPENGQQDKMKSVLQLSSGQQQQPPRNMRPVAPVVRGFRPQGNDALNMPGGNFHSKIIANAMKNSPQNELLSQNLIDSSSMCAPQSSRLVAAVQPRRQSIPQEEPQPRRPSPPTGPAFGNVVLRPTENRPSPPRSSPVKETMPHISPPREMPTRVSPPKEPAARVSIPREVPTMTQNRVSPPREMRGQSPIKNYSQPPPPPMSNIPPPPPMNNIPPPPPMNNIPPPPPMNGMGPPPPPPPPGPMHHPAGTHNGERRTSSGKKIVTCKGGPELDPREELMMAIRSFGGGNSGKLRRTH